MKFEIKRASHTIIDDMPDYLGPDVKNAYKEVIVPYVGSEGYAGWFIEIRTLEELIALQEEVGKDLIFNNHSVWIYDDYME